MDEDGVVLVDSGMTSDAAAVLNGLAMLDRTPADVHTILLTHWHNDHAAGAARMKALSNARVHYHERERPYLERETARGGFPGWLSSHVPERGPLVLFRGLLSAATSKAVSADVLVNDNDLVLGRFRVVETSGHTPGHLAYFHEPSGVLFAGDALAVIGGEASLHGATRHPRPRGGPRLDGRSRCAAGAVRLPGSPRAAHRRRRGAAAFAFRARPRAGVAAPGLSSSAPRPGGIAVARYCARRIARR